MTKHLIPILAATALFATSCSTDELSSLLPDSMKTPIEFSMTDAAGTQASGTMTRAGFTASTRIIARMQSDKKDATSETRYTKCVMTATTQTSAEANGYSTVAYASDAEKRYWDDAFGRQGQISVYAVAIPNSQDATKLQESLITGGNSWKSETTPNNTIAWSVTTDQSGNPLNAEDLAYSNNIQQDGKDGRYTWNYEASKYPDLTGATTHSNGRLIFTQAANAQPSDAGHFDKGHLVFKHGLSRMTVTLAEGEGFDKTKKTDFTFTTKGDNIQLNNMPTSGKLDIKAGTWSDVTTGNITKMAPASTYTDANGTYAAQMLPGYKLHENGTTNVMQFVIDNNTYYITEGQIYTALNTTANSSLLKKGTDSNVNYIEMGQGQNYALSVTVNKTGIQIVSATLAPWVDVTGSIAINNAHLTFDMTTSGTACDKDIDLYRLGDDNPNYDANKYDFSYEGKNWFGNYTDKTTLEHSAANNHQWKTNWYFESNKTYYHFRTVNKGTEIKGNATDNHDYFEISGGATSSTDPHWGAPMTGSDKSGYLKYDTEKGYEAFLRPAIGATESNIAIQEIHMMSNIRVILKTPTDGGKVLLKDGNTETTVKITRLATNGQVEMGRGVVTPTAPTGGYNSAECTMTNPSTFWKTEATETEAFTYTVVPQTLVRKESSKDDADYVGIFIQTPDHNQYYVVKKLSTILASTVSDGRDQAQGAAITRWFPGHTYTYTITISKTGIQAVTATVADWVTVDGKNIDIDLED